MLKVPLCKNILERTMDLDICSSTSLECETKSDMKNSTILKTPEKSQTSSYTYRQNHVSTVLLNGIPIVSLHIDGKERLCLAQISNTLLKQFSYNEIHNRRVALGITCVQCTPVQLEILRRAGAMPISSRRCGMITKREAERLVKSFLEDNRPPKLPDNFYFEVFHCCGWGCKGKFEPSRYNSSRAKCIRCNFCNLYFSPNKFIFHFHRAADSKYNHPDAANFNSWRRHLNLSKGADNDDIHHAWEDVKAMFNGGSRKRMLSSDGYTDSQPTHEEKRQKPSTDDGLLAKSSFGSQYQSYPLFSMPGKTYPFGALNTPNPLALQYQINKAELRNEGKQTQNIAFHPWRQSTDYIIPPYDLFWSNQFASRQGGLPGFGKNYFNSSNVKDLTTSISLGQSPSDTHTSSEDEESISQTFGSPSEPIKSSSQSCRPSAFRPVGKSSRNEKAETSIEQNNDELIRDDTENINNSDLDESDIDIEDECVYNDSVDNNKTEITDNRLYSPDTSVSTNIDGSNGEESRVQNPVAEEHISEGRSSITGVTDFKQDEREVEENKTQILDNEVEDDINSNKPSQLSLEDVNNMTKEELQKQLKSEMDIRKQVEEDINKIKKSLQDQVTKEKSQRDEITQQLQAMKDALCNELEQERKIRFSMQQKLKEAHDALHNFSCKMFTNKPCTDCVIKEAMRQ
ncbi:SKI family transcriptional corepressor 1 homolog-B-like [Mercenaria mercenaria]|uniref:SKI family transcriptional corepressor 1 homolog-B-like n=1 Tax=Mercenaria mercenaria TaxID=6596 RepID=UPI00234EDEEA|nr:SKI family transcriptional corepressor 1 homolog-B-like [Mercenaria mercenaria]